MAVCDMPLAAYHTRDEIGDFLYVGPIILKNHIASLRSQGDLNGLKDAVHASTSSAVQPISTMSILTSEVDALRSTMQAQNARGDVVEKTAALVYETQRALSDVKENISEKLGEINVKRDEATNMTFDLHNRFDALSDRLFKSIETSVSLATAKSDNVSRTEKGRRGEEFFDSIVQETPGISTWFLEDTSGIAGRGDRSCSDGNGFTAMIEMKNVESRLHTKQDIEKFTRDAKVCLADGSYDAAMLVSLRTKTIQGRGAVYLEYVHQKPVLWLCSDSPATISAALVMLRGVAMKSKQDKMNVPDLALQDRTIVTSLVQSAVACLLTNKERADSLQRNIEESIKFVNAIRDDMQKTIVEQTHLVEALTFGGDIESTFFTEALEWFTSFFEKNKKHVTKRLKIPLKIQAFLKRSNNTCDAVRDHVAKRLRLSTDDE